MISPKPFELNVNNIFHKADHLSKRTKRNLKLSRNFYPMNTCSFFYPFNELKNQNDINLFLRKSKIEPQAI